MLLRAGELEHTSKNVWQALSGFWGSKKKKATDISETSTAKSNKLIHK